MLIRYLFNLHVYTYIFIYIFKYESISIYLCIYMCLFVFILIHISFLTRLFKIGHLSELLSCNACLAFVTSFICQFYFWGESAAPGQHNDKVAKKKVFKKATGLFLDINCLFLFL